MTNTVTLFLKLLFVASALLLWSCEEGEEIQTQEDLTSVTPSFLSNSNAAINRLRSKGFMGPMGAMFGNGSARTAVGRTASPESPIAMMRGVNLDESDSTDTGTSCLVETWEEDGTGNYTYTLDFGEGCNYFGELLFGKLVEKGFYSETGFNASTTYSRFGGSSSEESADWWIDGTYSYEGSFSFEEGETSDPSEEDSLGIFSATYSFAANITESYQEYNEEADLDTEEYIVTFIAQGAEEINELGYTVTSMSEEVSVNTGESYTSAVIIPLFLSYACQSDDVWIFVSGEESGTYTYQDIMGTFSINYGNGTCDNIVTVTENGVSEEIDLGEEWDDWEEHCGEED